MADGTEQGQQGNGTENAGQAQPQLTYGGKAVGLTFNPSNNGEVDNIKRSAATFIDTICGPDGGKLTSTTDGEIIAMRKLALRAAQEAQMWAVKAATWQP